MEHASGAPPACPLRSVVGKPEVGQLSADKIIAEDVAAVRFFRHGAEIDQIVAQFAVHAYLHSLLIAAESSIMKASCAIHDQRRDKASYVGGDSSAPLRNVEQPIRTQPLSFRFNN